MYEQFFGLKEKPFSLLPDPSYLYMSEGHDKALTLLRYGILGRQGFTVVTGEIGCGKTTLINRLLEETNEETTVGVLNFTDPGAVDLNEWIGMAYGLEYRGKSRVEIYDDFMSFLNSQYARGKYTVLIVDEAQNLVIKGLENVRVLSNVNAQKKHLLHLILVGQPQLRGLLATPDLEQFVQRISLSYHLAPLSLKDAKAYILHRLRVAGATNKIFSPQAIRMLAESSNGVPRIINTLCDLALVYGFSAAKRLIDARIVKAVLEDREEMGLRAGALSGNVVPSAIAGSSLSHY